MACHNLSLPAVGILAAWLWTAAVQPAHAAHPQAVRLFKAGKEAFAQGRFEEAAAHFQNAYTLEAKPFLLYNIALCHEKRGDVKTALEYYERYLKLAPGEAAHLTRHLDSLRAQAAPARVFLRGGVHGSEVWLDNVPAGLIPLAAAIELPPGKTAVLQVRREGYHIFEARLQASPGGTLEVTVSQTPLETPPPSPREPEIRLTLPKTATLNALQLHEFDIRPSRSLRLPAWMTVAGVALLAGAGAVGLWAMKTADNATHTPSWEMETREDRAQQARRQALAADVLAATGIVCISLGLYFFF